jgi:hypothetical protein
LLRFLLVEAAQAAARIHPDWRSVQAPGAASAQEYCQSSDGRRLAIRTTVFEGGDLPVSFSSGYIPHSWQFHRDRIPKKIRRIL